MQRVGEIASVLKLQASNAGSAGVLACTRLSTLNFELARVPFALRAHVQARTPALPAQTPVTITKGRTLAGPAS